MDKNKRGGERKVKWPVYAHEVEFTVTETIVTWWCCGSMALFFQLLHITTSEMQSINLLQQIQISKVQIKTIISKVLPAWSQLTARRSGLRKRYACLSACGGCLMGCSQVPGAKVKAETQEDGKTSYLKPGSESQECHQHYFFLCLGIDLGHKWWTSKVGIEM